MLIAFYSNVYDSMEVGWVLHLSDIAITEARSQGQHTEQVVVTTGYSKTNQRCNVDLSSTLVLPEYKVNNMCPVYKEALSRNENARRGPIILAVKPKILENLWLNRSPVARYQFSTIKHISTVTAYYY